MFECSHVLVGKKNIINHKTAIPHVEKNVSLVCPGFIVPTGSPMEIFTWSIVPSMQVIPYARGLSLIRCLIMYPLVIKHGVRENPMENPRFLDDSPKFFQAKKRGFPWISHEPGSFSRFSIDTCTKIPWGSPPCCCSFEPWRFGEGSGGNIKEHLGTSWNIISHRIHGAGIYANIKGVY